MGGYYPSQCGVDVAFELEMYDNRLNTAHYLQHSLEKQSDVDNAMKMNKEGLQYFAPATYKPYTEYVYWTADAPPTRDERERCQNVSERFIDMSHSVAHLFNQYFIYFFFFRAALLQVVLFSFQMVLGFALLTTSATVLTQERCK